MTIMNYEWYPDDYNNYFLEQWYCDIGNAQLCIGRRGILGLMYGHIYITVGEHLYEYGNLLKRKQFTDFESAKRHVESVFDKMLDTMCSTIFDG